MNQQSVLGSGQKGSQHKIQLYESVIIVDVLRQIPKLLTFNKSEPISVTRDVRHDDDLIIEPEHNTENTHITDLYC